MDWFDLAQDRDRWRAVVNVITSKALRFIRLVTQCPCAAHTLKRNVLEGAACVVLCGQLKWRSTEVCLRSRNSVPFANSLPIICGVQEDSSVFRLPVLLLWTGLPHQSVHPHTA